MPGEPAEFHTRDGLVLRGEAFGAAHAPPALLLHGGGQTHHAWKGSAESLAAAGWRAVAMDLRGHGDSDWAPDGDYRFDRYADDLLDMAGALLARPVVVGASLGGMAILMAAARAAAFPFAACVLVDITPRVRPEGVAEILGFMSAGLEDGFESIEAAAEAVARYLPHRPRPVAAKGLEKNLRRGPDGRYRWHWDPKFVTGPLCVPGQRGRGGPRPRRPLPHGAHPARPRPSLESGDGRGLGAFPLARARQPPGGRLGRGPHGRGRPQRRLHGGDRGFPRGGARRRRLTHINGCFRSGAVASAAPTSRV